MKSVLRQTRMGWRSTGRLKSTQLKQVILVPQFWFAWSQFPLGDQSLHRT